MLRKVNFLLITLGVGIFALTVHACGSGTNKLEEATPTSGPSQVFDGRRLYKSVSESVVTVENQKGEASGFFISTSEVVTNAHVVGKQRFVPVATKRGILGATVVGVNKKLDTALLKVRVGSTGFAPLKMRSEKIGATEDVQPLIGTHVALFGTPLGLQGSMVEGTITGTCDWDGIAPPIMKASAHSFPGNSGGPLVDIRGDLVGIAVGTDKPRKQKQKNLGGPVCVIPASVVMEAVSGIRKGKD